MLLGARYYPLRPNLAPTRPPVPPSARTIPSSTTYDPFLRSLSVSSARSVLKACSSRTRTSLFVTLCNKSEAQLLSSLTFAHSSRKYRDGTKSDVQPSESPTCQRLSALSPLEATLTDKHRVLPCFGRNRPPASPLELCAIPRFSRDESALAELRSVSPLEATLTKNGGSGVPADSPEGPLRHSTFGRAAAWSPRRCLMKSSHSLAHAGRNTEHAA